MNQLKYLINYNLFDMLSTKGQLNQTQTNS